MYIILKDGSLVSKVESLSVFLYSEFDFEIIEGKVFIRPKNYEAYENKEYREISHSYSDEFSETEIIKDFCKFHLKDYVRPYGYEIYKVQSI